ncbi:hypothetical protein F4803DRAFT_556337 [Xylaria telfairii]|nr:hypothetical protein F4803DRAFT_556337 [Xylaria telfairii]
MVAISFTEAIVTLAMDKAVKSVNLGFPSGSNLVNPSGAISHVSGVSYAIIVTYDSGPKRVFLPSSETWFAFPAEEPIKFTAGGKAEKVIYATDKENHALTWTALS